MSYINDPEEYSKQAPISGDFEAFLQREFAPLVTFLTKRQVQVEDAEDIAQESQIRLTRYGTQPEDVLRAMMYRIALNLVRDHYRKNTIRPFTVQYESTNEIYGIPGTNAGPDEQLLQRQQLERIRSAIAKLPSHCRKIYLLNRVEGMSYPQIARHSGVSVKAIEKQISKALALLRQDLGTNSMFSDHGN